MNDNKSEKDSHKRNKELGVAESSEKLERMFMYMQTEESKKIIDDFLASDSSPKELGRTFVDSVIPP